MCILIRACSLSLGRGKLRQCSANQRPVYLSNLPCDWPSTAWAYSKQKTETGPWLTCEYSTKVVVLTRLTVWIETCSPIVTGIGRWIRWVHEQESQISGHETGVHSSTVRPYPKRLPWCHLRWCPESFIPVIMSDWNMQWTKKFALCCDSTSKVMLTHWS